MKMIVTQPLYAATGHHMTITGVPVGVALNVYKEPVLLVETQPNTAESHDVICVYVGNAVDESFNYLGSVENSFGSLVVVYVR